MRSAPPQGAGRCRAALGIGADVGASRPSMLHVVPGVCVGEAGRRRRCSPDSLRARASAASSDVVSASEAAASLRALSFASASVAGVAAPSPRRPRTGARGGWLRLFGRSSSWLWSIRSFARQAVGVMRSREGTVTRTIGRWGALFFATWQWTAGLAWKYVAQHPRGWRSYQKNRSTRRSTPA